MEKEHKEKNSIDGQTIESIKAALMGPTAGMFDSLFFNCLRIIAAGIGIGLCAEGSNFGYLDLHPALRRNTVHREVFLCKLGLCLWYFVY